MREARYDDQALLDEVVADDVANFHLEQMDDRHWWIGLEHKDGTTTHIRLFTDRRNAAIVGLCDFNV